MTERIYDNKFLGDTGGNGGGLQHNTSQNRGSNLLAQKSAAPNQLPIQEQPGNSKNKLQIGSSGQIAAAGRKKAMINNSNSRNDKNSIGYSNSYTQNTEDQKTTNLAMNFSSRTFKQPLISGPGNMMLGVPATGASGTQKVQMYGVQHHNDAISSKKQRRLKKNFDLLSQALKNPNVFKREKKINMSSSETRAYNSNNTGSIVPQIQQMVAPQVYQQNNFINQGVDSSNSPQQQQKQRRESVAQVYQYGAHIQQPFKDRKSSAYEVLIHPKQAHSQRVKSQNHSNNSTQNHNASSLFSHISIKDSNQTPNKSQISYQTQSRNPSMMIYQNISNNTQPVLMNEQRSFIKINDKLMRRYILNENQQPLGNNNINNNIISSGSNSQAVLNINTASDINIYNNSFIVNTTSKKQSQSQGQSRSNSLKRNQQQAVANLNAINQRKQSQQQIQKIIYNNTNNNNNNNHTGSGINILSAQQQMDYNKLYQNKPSSSQGRANSQQKIPSIQNINNTQKINQVADAYTTKSFFNSVMGGSQNQVASQNNQILSMFAGTKNPNSQHKKTSSSKSLKRNQASHTQSFDLQPFSSSTENELSGSVSQNFRQKYSQKFKYSSGNLQGRGQRAAGVRGQQDRQNIDDSYSPEQNENSKMKMISMNLLNQGKNKLIERDYQNAINLFSESFKLDHTNIDAKFYKAVSMLDSGSIQEAIIELKEILKISPDHSQLSHILLSIAYKRSNDMQQALQILDQCILRHPSYPDAFLARGQALLIQEKFDFALKDFQQYTKLCPSHGIGFVGAGDSQKALRLWLDSINSYTKALALFQKQQKPQTNNNERKNNINQDQNVQNEDNDQIQNHIISTLLKRGLSYYYLKKNQQALSDLQQVVNKDSTQYKAHFFIGKLMARQYAVTPRLESNSKNAQRLQNDAILHFEQVVKYHQLNEVYSGNALFEIAKLRLKDKDFYEAYFNLKRALDSNFTSKRLQLYKDFTEGVLYLIKRKIKKGVQILSDLLEVLVNNQEKKDKKQFDWLRHQAYIYRAYGYVAIEKYEIALKDIKRAKKIGQLDQPSIYNKLLGKGILRMDHEDYLMATKYFNKASLRFPLNKDPYCLYIISIVRSYSYSMANLTVDDEDKKEKVMQAKAFMDQAINNCYKVKIPSLFFFRGLLYFQLHKFYEALHDFNVAIEEEEEPTASYYLARGRCYACLSILTEAMKDLSIALNLDDSLQEAYIYRGKCAYLLGDNNLAFLDFQRLILTDPKNPMVHVYAGNLLMTTGAYQDAIKAFMNADTVQKTAVAAFQRARCYCALTDLENAKMQFKSALDLSKNEYLVKVDSQCLTALMKVINTSSKNPNREKALNEALNIVDKLIEIFESNKIQELHKKDALLNIQIIPNVKRIKIEKVAVAKELIAQQADQKDVTISIDVSQTVDLDILNQIPLFSYYYENVFQLEDFHLFRAVFYFYKGEYQKAIQDYLYCSNQRNNEKDGSNKDKSPTGNRDDRSSSPDNKNIANNLDHVEQMMVYSRHSQSSTPMLSGVSSKTDLSDVGLCSLNVHETNFNILLCFLMISEYNKALEKVNEIIGMAPKKYQKHFFLIRGLIYEQTNQLEKAQKDFEKYYIQDPKNSDSYFKDKKDLIFEPFPIKSRLCSKFENIRIIISKDPNRPAILTKPSFSMPFIKPPNMIPNIDEEVIQNEFTLKQIDAPMPEAPWIRRCEFGIKFTDDIIQDDQEDMVIESDLNQTNNQGEKDHDKNQNAPLKGNSQSRKQKVSDDTPKDQSIDADHTSCNGKTNAYKGISERILKNAQVYLVDNEEQELISDKHKISLFDDSKYEDLTIDNINNQNNKRVRTILDSRLIGEESLDQADELMQQHLLKNNGEEEEDDDDSSEDEDGSGTGNTPAVVFDRDSMVLVGESVAKKGKRKQRIQMVQIQSNQNNAILIESEDEEQREKIMSELQSNIDYEEDDQRDSIFRSRQSSRR